jgi:hypothetical protein
MLEAIICIALVGGWFRRRVLGLPRMSRGCRQGSKGRAGRGSASLTMLKGLDCSY